MVFAVGLAPTAAAIVLRPSLSLYYNKRKNSELMRASLNAHKDEDDPLFEAAIRHASLRFQETLRPEPLLVDPYAGCFVPHSVEVDEVHAELPPHQYCLATRFIDDKLLAATKEIEGLKQVVLLTDGIDTRPYRLNWLPSTIIYDISPERIFTGAARKLGDVGAKIPRSCLFFQIPLDSSDIQQILRSKGFTGNRPSIWALQGLPLVNLASFKEILFLVSSLAMKGCIFLGEFPGRLTETEIGIKCTTKEWMENLFMSYDFRVDMIGYDEVARNLDKEPALGDYKNTLFVAEHLRYSDDQMENWRREFQRVEEDADEEGFEEL
ncbi:hypothetical protein RJ640_019926 [Escallonia rubra]|uniref:S-adenosyl-L-methionine-dependent methyltransferase n=1 Tax=Escallonia rubra TaxID=112253 RepID=A0AA88QNA9_9ASTE|nr:hypothetical protein RJ640_019926 [Escallonia rubra]